MYFRLSLMLLFLVSLPNRTAAAEITAKLWYKSQFNIIILGPIVGGDDEKFKRLVLSWLGRGLWLGQVMVYSEGGDVAAATAIGRQIRLLKSSTHAPNVDRSRGAIVCDLGPKQNATVVYNIPEAGEGERRCRCESACFLIWAAGTGRFGKVVGIHSPRFADQSWYASLSGRDANNAYQKTIDMAGNYLKEMDVPPSIATKMFAFNSSQMYYLDANELLLMNNYPSYLRELLLARCGQAPGDKLPFAVRKPYEDCADTLYSEVPLQQAKEYLARYRQPN